MWTYRESHTTCYERGMRNNYGKGVAYAEVDGRGVIYTSSPGVFPPCAGRENRAAAGELGHPGASGGFFANGDRGHAAGKV